MERNVAQARRCPRLRFMQTLYTRHASGGAQLSASPLGGQVLGWRDAAGRDLLYLSPDTRPGAPVRGGVPVCFPQFAGRGPLVKHGFARTADWDLVDGTAGDCIHLRLAQPQAAWPQGYQLDLLARIEDRALDLQLTVTNTGGQPWGFTGALHTYLRVADVAQVRLQGLETCDCEDALAGGALLREGRNPDLSQPVDRVYRQVPGPVLVSGAAPALRIVQEGFSDVVVWNPGTGGRPADLPAADVPHMLCVEAAVVSQPVQLATGDSWQGRQRLELL